jgi:hypothetical protein
MKSTVLDLLDEAILYLGHRKWDLILLNYDGISASFRKAAFL